MEDIIPPVTQNLRAAPISILARRVRSHLKLTGDSRSLPANRSSVLTHTGMAKAPNEVVVHQPSRLHQGVADGRADERETPAFQVLAQASEASVRAGTSLRALQVFRSGCPPTNGQI